MKVWSKRHRRMICNQFVKSTFCWLLGPAKYLKDVLLVVKSSSVKLPYPHPRILYPCIHNSVMKTL